MNFWIAGALFGEEEADSLGAGLAPDFIGRTMRSSVEAHPGIPELISDEGAFMGGLGSPFCCSMTDALWLNREKWNEPHEIPSGEVHMSRVHDSAIHSASRCIVAFVHT